MVPIQVNYRNKEVPRRSCDGELVCLVQGTLDLIPLITEQTIVCICIGSSKEM